MTTKPLFSPQLLETVESVLYQVPASKTTVLGYVSLHNTSTSPVTVTISTPDQGEVSSASNQLSVKTVAGLELLKINEAVGDILATGTSIRAVASVGGVVNIRAGGVEA